MSATPSIPARHRSRGALMVALSAVAGIVMLSACVGDDSGSTGAPATSTATATMGSAATGDESSSTDGTTTSATSADASATAASGEGTSSSSSSTSAGESEGEVESGSSTTGEGLVLGLVAVGYGGIRVVSRDLGESWGDRSSFAPDGVDDQDLLRAVTYGDGLWVASGWRYVTSTDGVEWVDHGLLNENEELGIPCNIVEGLAFADGYFYAACTNWEGFGKIFRSADGLSFEPWSMIDDPGGHLFLTHRGGVFVAYGDHGTSYVSDDAVEWSVMPGLVDATYCEDAWRSAVDCYDASWFDGAYFRGQWSNKILRSTDGVEWATVYEDLDEDNVPYRARAIASGMVAPSP